MTTLVQRDRLEALRNRREAARDRKAEARTALAAARNVKDKDAEALAQQAFDEAHADDEIVSALETVALRQIVGGVPEFGAALANNLDTQRTLSEIAASSAQLQAPMHLGAVLSMEDTLDLTGSALRAAPVVTPDGAGGTNWLGIAPTPAATPTALLDLFQSAPMTTRSVEYLRREGGIANAGIQQPGAVKAEAAITYVDADAEAATVASWTKVRRDQVDDVTGLLADIQSALRDGVMTKVEVLLVGSPALSGAPTPGILGTSGLLAPTISAATPLADAVGQAKAQLAVTGVQANFVAAHPMDIEDEEERTGNDGHYVQTIDDAGRIRRLPLVSTIALSVGEVLVGNSAGARLGVRQPVSAVASQESDDFTRNRLTILVEGRWAPVVEVPAYFAHFQLS